MAHDQRKSLTTFTDIEAELAHFEPRRLSRKAYTLEHMERLLDFLDNPQHRYKVVHVAGTSGKTSTAYYAAALLKQAGYKTGLTVSPYTYTVNERVQIGLEPLPEHAFGAELSVFLELVDESGIVPTYFELVMAFAFWEFARAGVDVAVIEVGLGGLLDATNTIMRADKVCIITDIGLDHTNILGHTFGEIAAQKAGIIQLHNAVFCYEQSRDVMAPIALRAQQKSADLHTFDQLPLGPKFAFLPLFQRRNFALALQAVTWFLERENHTALTAQARLAAARIRIPGRLEKHALGDKIILLDGAHNGQKMAALRQSLHETYAERPIAVLTAMLATEQRRVPDCAHELARFAHAVIATEFKIEGHPAVDAHELAQAITNAGLTNVASEPNLAHAWRMLLSRPEEVLLVTGSLYVLGQIKRELDRAFDG